MPQLWVRWTTSPPAPSWTRSTCSSLTTPWACLPKAPSYLWGEPGPLWRGKEVGNIFGLAGWKHFQKLFSTSCNFSSGENLSGNIFSVVKISPRMLFLPSFWGTRFLEVNDTRIISAQPIWSGNCVCPYYWFNISNLNPSNQQPRIISDQDRPQSLYYPFLKGLMSCQKWFLLCFWKAGGSRISNSVTTRFTKVTRFTRFWTVKNGWSIFNRSTHNFSLHFSLTTIPFSGLCL